MSAPVGSAAVRFTMRRKEPEGLRDDCDVWLFNDAKGAVRRLGAVGPSTKVPVITLPACNPFTHTHTHTHTRTPPHPPHPCAQTAARAQHKPINES